MNINEGDIGGWGSKHKIPFTQYLRPHGKRQAVFFYTDSKELYDKAQRIIDSGLAFECEVLMNGVVSFTISNGEEDLAIELAENGPKVPAAVTKLINDFKENP